jgi:hypothetical protein
VLERWQTVEPAVRAALVCDTPPADATLRRWVAAMGRVRTASVLRVAAARWGAERAAGQLAPAPHRVASLYRRALRTAFREPVELADLAVDGDDVRDAGVPAGPLLGQVLQRLLDLVIENPALNSRDRLLEHARASYDELARER